MSKWQFNRRKVSGEDGLIFKVLNISFVLLDPSLIIPNIEYDGLEESIKISIYSQGDNNIFLTIEEDSSSSPVDQLIQTDSNEPSTETPDERFLREAFPDAVLPKSPLLNLTEGTLL